MSNYVIAAEYFGGSRVLPASGTADLSEDQQQLVVEETKKHKFTPAQLETVFRFKEWEPNQGLPLMDYFLMSWYQERGF